MTSRESARREFASARAKGYGLAALNAVNLETASAIVAAAELESSPIILSFSENAVRYAGFDLLLALGRELRGKAAVPILLHYDHAESPATAEKAFEAGFDSVMLELDDVFTDSSTRLLKRVVDKARSNGAMLEVECDVVAKGSRQTAQLADPSQIAQLAEDTGAELLAVNLGTRHKELRKATKLDLDRLKSIAASTTATLVLHGASGVPREEISAAVRLGIGKVNVGTELMLAFTDAVRRRLEDPRVYDLRDYLGQGRSSLVDRARQILQTVGSAGHAP